MGSNAGFPTNTQTLHAPAQHLTGNASLLLEKTKLGLRRSTPDSEALASSDDEQDPARHLARIQSHALPKPTRPPSWITENDKQGNRKGSIGAGGTLAAEITSPIPAGDFTGWGPSGSPLARVNSNGNSYPWGNNIWGHVPPTRLSEFQPHTNGLEEESFRNGGGRRDSNLGAAIPFAIPLKPTLKAYRSQSYSVGQMEQDLNNAAQAKESPYSYNNRARAGTPYGLQQRGSRPTLTGDYHHDGTVLEQLNEVEDDDGSFNSQDFPQQPAAEQRTRQQLERENALLRENNELRQQLVSLNLSSQSEQQNHSESTARYDQRYSRTSDEALDDPDEGLLNDGLGYGRQRPTRRMSEFAGAGNGQPGNRAIEIVKRGQWISSLGFDGIAEAPQSRRHSFADAPKRQQSAASLGGDHRLGEGTVLGANMMSNDQGMLAGRQAWNTSDEMLHAHQIQQMSASRFGPQAGSYARFPYPGGMQPSRGQRLYLVTFKSSRAEFYYVADGIGLEIKAGDVVIVEADRGTDLGTVQQENIAWSEAKAVKEHFTEEHYKWLMMFSRRRQEGANGNSGSASRPMSGAGEGALGFNHGSQMGQVNAPDPAATEIKPKMIKRLAQPHEIQMLKEKEANEAKAKRICQVKADEHHLDMEILDAEFQMDWKKLTFYYYAESYVNFNSLVTDLFKTYKTRIWMSAINPASFLTAAAGLPPPSIIGPGAILTHRLGSRAFHFEVPQLTKSVEARAGGAWTL